MKLPHLPWISGKSTKKPDSFRYLSRGFFALLLLSVGSLLWAEGGFDPSTVRPKGCNPSEQNCGYQPSSPAAMRAIPVAPSAEIRHRGLPSSMDLSPNMPPVGNQGQQASCVAWAVAYATKSYQEKVEHNWAYDAPVKGGPGNRIFSPAYIYNQINGGRDSGSVIDDAMRVAVQQGVAPWAVMPYTDGDYRRQPNSSARQQAQSYKAQSFKRLPYTNLDAIKSELVNGNPVVFGIPVDDAFYNLGRKVYDRQGGQNYGGHAMALVGYDDSKRSPNGDVGAFKFINSWGTQWGENGYGWISYRMWKQLGAYAMVMYDATSDGPQPGPTTTQTNTSTDKLSPPSSVTASRGTYPDKIQVSWSAVDGAVVYAVYRAEPGGESFQQMGYEKSTSYMDTKVEPGVAYKYILIAVESSDNYSDPRQSPVAEGYAQANSSSAPGKVTGLEANLRAVSGTSVALEWNSIAGAQSYQIARYDSNSKSWRALGTSSSASYNDTSPGSNVTVAYAVRAINAKGAGDWSDPVQINLPGSNTKPEQPSQVAASRGLYKDHIEVEWPPVSGATKYYVFRYDYSKRAWEGPKSTNGTSYVDSDGSVRSGRWFAYAVVASNSAGNSNYSKPALGRANPNAQRAGMVLPPPENLRATQNSAGEVTLQWDAVKGASEYYVFRTKARGEDLLDNDSGSDYEFVSSVPGSTTQFKEKLPGEAGDLFLYVVRTKSELGGESENSEAASAYKDPEVVAVKHRLLPGAGLDRFQGTWAGQYYDGKVRKVTLSVNASGSNFTLQLSVDGSSKTYQGKYAAMSDVLDTGALVVRLDQQDSDLLYVEAAEEVPGAGGRNFTVVKQN